MQPSAVMIGQNISQYEIVEKLGEGGMGVVYKAHDSKLDRFVALKFLPAQLASSAQDKARFTQEAKAAAALNHPNVCSIIDIQDHDGQMFIVMEFVDGQTLRERAGSITFKQGIEIGVQIAEGLAAAHEKGIVHRDIKPENIMIRRDGIAQIMDFGLAKLRNANSKVSRLTREGSTIGTAGYMSPEQIQGQDTDHRSDIFSFGVLLYELLTGGLPFKGVHETALAYEIVNVDPPPMSAVRDGIDPALDAIVLECLEKDPNERTQSIKQVAIDLKRMRRESTKQRLTRAIPARQYTTTSMPAARYPELHPSATHEIPTGGPTPQPGSGTSWVRFIAPGLCVILAGALAYVLLRPAGSSNELSLSPHLQINLPENARLVGGSDGIAISPDGRFVTYTGALPNTPSLFLRRIDQTEVIQLPGTEGGDEPCFSPDGQWIAFSQGGKIKKVSISGGVSQEICVLQGVARGLLWTPDNMIYYGHIARGIQRISAAGGQSEPVTTLDSAQGEISHRYPQMLPDGKTLVYTIKQKTISSFDDALIAMERLDTHEKKVVIHGGTCARVTPNGFLVFVKGKSIYAVPYDADKLEVKGSPVELMEGGWQNPAAGASELAFSKAGTLIYSTESPVSFNQIALSWMDANGKLTQILDSLRWFGGVTMSPDGEKIALTISAANDDIWLFNLKRGMLSRVTFGGGNHANQIWTPDGKYIIYASETEKAMNIFRKPWDGGGAEERLTESMNAQYPSDVSPDGSTLAFSQAGDVWTMALEKDRTPHPFIQTQAVEANAVFSPNGKWVAYESNESGKPEVYVTTFPSHDSKWQVSNGGGVQPTWSRDRKQLLYIAGVDVMAVDITATQAFDFTSPKKIFTLPANGAGFYDLNRINGRIVVTTASFQQLTSPKIDVIVNWFQEIENKMAQR